MHQNAVADLINTLSDRIEQDDNYLLRLHLSDAPDLAQTISHVYEEDEKRLKQSLGKPCGIWWGVNASWLGWLLDNQTSWTKKYLYSIHPDPKTMLTISNSEEFHRFEREYLTEEFLIAMIDWNRVRGRYESIEISPYQWKQRLWSFWYYGWDCASGCTWSSSSTVRLIGMYNEEQQKYELFE